MREYIFHGKCRDEDKWVEGYLIHYGDYCCILQDEDKLHPIDVPYMNDLGCIDGYATPVIPESVGEWTGLVDNNGRKIFEGDIVRCQERFDRPYSDKRKSKRHIGVVEYRIGKGDNFYNRQTGKYDRHMEYSAEWIVNVKDYGKFVHGSWGDFWDCEVIGTVFENANLLEG